METQAESGEDTPATLTVTPIGMIRTPYRERYRAPRQPGGAPVAAEGVITLIAGHNFEQALADLAGFERIWLIYWFDRNTGWRPKVTPPRGDARRGVFATRSPHRPNPLGLSLVTLIVIRGRTIRVGEVDLLDGTPILDLKPYLPAVEAFPDARAGWLDDLPNVPFAVLWAELATAQARWVEAQTGLDLAAWTTEVLARDPSPHPSRRIRHHKSELHELAVQSWRVRFRLDDEIVQVVAVESGYPLESLGRDDLHHANAHRSFHQLWPGSNFTV